MAQMSVKIIIEFIVEEGKGKCNVTGPLEDDVLCFGLLEKAKQTIIDHNRKLQEGKAGKGFPAGGMLPAYGPKGRLSS